MAAPASSGSFSRRWRVFAGVAVLLTGLKLWWAAPDEIVARPNTYDQLRYAEMANELIEGRWFGIYGPRTLIREPAYPTWIAAIHYTGMRLRMASELLLVASAWAFGASVLRVGAPLWLSLVIMGSLLLHPHGMLVHRELLAESFYVPMLLLALSGLLMAVRARGSGWRLVHAGWAGFALGLLWTTRPEKPLLVALLGAAALLAFATAWGRSARLAGACVAALVVAGMGGAGIAAVSGGFASRNQHHYGVRVTADLAAPGYVAANRALLSIEHAAPRRFVPVPAEVRARAYAASPAFRELRPHLETRGWAHRVSCVMVKVCDDLAGGWFLWSLREAAALAGRMRSAPEAEAYFHRIARELEQACQRGELRCRRALLSFLHPHPEAWLPWLPESLLDVLGRIATPGRARDRLPAADDRDTSVELRALFDHVARRNPELSATGWIAVEGHVTADDDPIRRIDLRSGRERMALVTGAGEVAESGSQRVPVSFQLKPPPRRRVGRRPVLEVTRASGVRTRLPLSDAFEAPVERDGLRIEITARPVRPHDQARLAFAWLSWHGHALAIVALTAGAAVLGFVRRSPRLADPLWTVFALLAVVCAGRILLLAMIDASSFAAASSRYVYPASALAIPALLVFVVAMCRAPSRSRVAP